MPDFRPLDLDFDNAPLFNERIGNGWNSWPGGFFCTYDTIIGNGDAHGVGINPSPLPTSQYRDGGTAPNSTVICHLGDGPAIRTSGMDLTGVTLQRGEFKRDANRDPIPPLRDGSVGIEFIRGVNGPGGKCQLGTVGFIGFDCAVHVSSEANHIKFGLAVFAHNWTCYRSDHDQAFGNNIHEGHVSGYCDTIFDYERGGRGHHGFIYCNPPALAVRMRNLGPNRSSVTIDELHLDSQAKGWGLLDAPDVGWLKLRVGGHVAKGAVPREDWLRYTPSATTDVNYDQLWFPGQVRP